MFWEGTMTILNSGLVVIVITAAVFYFFGMIAGILVGLLLGLAWAAVWGMAYSIWLAWGVDESLRSHGE